MPDNDPDDYQGVKGSKTKRNNSTGEIWERDLLHRDHSNDCGFQLSPNGAGKSFFTKNSTKGLYIHRLNSTPIGNNQNEKAASNSQVT